MSTKPVCNLNETKKNSFFVVAEVSKVLKNAGLEEEAVEFLEQIQDSNSYNEIINIVNNYVEVC